jgi:hypothetical protein
MAVDGVALKGAIDFWVHAAAPADRAAALLVAEGIRWIEKALSGFFHLLNGTTLLALGLSITLGRRHARWLGLAAVAAGIGFLAGGTITALTGLSSQAATALAAPAVLSVVFVVGSCASMWRIGSAR